MNRRSFLRGLIAVVAAPAVIRTPGLLMPVRALAVAPPVELFIGPGPSPAMIEMMEQMERVRLDLIAYGRACWSETPDAPFRHEPLIGVYERRLTLPATPQA